MTFHFQKAEEAQQYRRQNMAMNFIPSIQLLFSPKLKDNKTKTTRPCLVSLIKIYIKIQSHLGRELEVQAQRRRIRRCQLCARAVRPSCQAQGPTPGCGAHTDFPRCLLPTWISSRRTPVIARRETHLTANIEHTDLPEEVQKFVRAARKSDRAIFSHTPVPLLCVLLPTGPN